MTDTNTLPVREKRQRGLTEQVMEPFHRLRREVDRMFDEFPAHIPSLQLPQRFSSALPVPAVEMSETEDAYEISVEVPGIASKDIDLQVERDMIVLKGEKREARKETERDFMLSERSYGSFKRRIALPEDSLRDRIEANTENGVLKIEIPRDKAARPERRKIDIKSQDKD